MGVGTNDFKNWVPLRGEALVEVLTERGRVIENRRAVLPRREVIVLFVRAPACGRAGELEEGRCGLGWTLSLTIWTIGRI